MNGNRTTSVVTSLRRFCEGGVFFSSEERRMIVRIIFLSLQVAICLDLCDLLWYLLLRKDRWTKQHENHRRSVLRTYIALRNEHFSHARIPETESPCHAERRFIKGNPLRQAEGTFRKTHGKYHRHILHLRAGYVHCRLPAWRKADDWCDKRRITAPVAPCKPMWAIDSVHTKMYPQKNPTGLNRTIWACWIFEESDISVHDFLFLRQSSILGTRCKTALLPEFSRCSFDDVPDGDNWIIHVKWGIWRILPRLSGIFRACPIERFRQRKSP